MRIVILFFAFLLASVGAFSLSFAADLLFGRFYGLYPDTVWLPIGTWSGLCVFLSFVSMRLSGKRWITIVPFHIFGFLALVGAIVGSHSHNFLVSVAMFCVGCWLSKKRE